LRRDRFADAAPVSAGRVGARGFGSDFEGLLAAALECFGAGAASRTAAAGADRETLADALRADARGLAASVARASFVLLGRGGVAPVHTLDCRLRYNL